MSGRSLLRTLLSTSSGRVDPVRDFTVNGLEWHGNLPPIDIAARAVIIPDAIILHPRRRVAPR